MSNNEIEDKGSVDPLGDTLLSVATFGLSSVLGHKSDSEYEVTSRDSGDTKTYHAKDTKELGRKIENGDYED